MRARPLLIQFLMKNLVKKSCCNSGKSTKKVAQCCAKVSVTIAGCHD